jgi:hypothetical protein
MLDKVLDLEHFETQNEAFIRKMRCDNTLGMFIKWSEKEVSLWIRNVLRIVSEIISGLNNRDILPSYPSLLNRRLD